MSAPKKIKIILNKSEVFIAESIKFQTTFLVREENSLKDELERINKNFLAFLEENKFDYEGPKPGTMNNNGFEYTYPSYIINLSYADYLKLEKYRDANSELAGHAMSSTFSKDSQKKLLEIVTEEAKKQAQELAETDKLTLQKDYEIKELELPLNSKKWTIYPPQSARYNHFRQSLEGNYEFIFTAE